ncbi:beta-ketoacyl-ACP reductase [Legionella antarctica]|uniref:Beta-ketoacyl-ACP reductase n=1 Tax=Legionella antarctica TaxID=2708020 RepID=A0A6F8T8W0_9GAMM|nr:SDR family oxidoreductase [Legionella antarctica]BCA96663.1 beta-ketoacyl-ACP reductase [Legionella antarctica]
MAMNDCKKTILITGGTSGIGRSLVDLAIARQYEVAYCARNKPQLNYKNHKVLFCQADVSQPDDMKHVVDKTVERFSQIDIVIHCAGISRDSLLVNLPAEQWDEVMAINLRSAFLLSRLAVGQFQRQEMGGHIAFLASLACYGAPSNACYAASKGGLLGLSTAIAEESSGSGITANSFILGLIDTPMTADYPDLAKQILIEGSPLKRHAESDEIALDMLYLSEHCRHLINGKHVHISGGLIDFPIGNRKS